MYELTIINYNGVHAIDSREVAEMVGKDHNILMRDIRTYCGYLGLYKIAQSDFFIESTYQNSQNKTQPCYLITKKGCDMVANKMTGEKGVLFTAAYVNKFHEMEQRISVPQSLPEALRLAADLAEQNAALSLTAAKQSQIIGELKPKADYVDWILQSPSLITTTAIAKDYGMSARTFNKLLHDKGIQFKQGDQWFLYRKYQDKGYTHSKTINITRSDGMPDISMQTKWTQKGRLFLYELLKADGILPMIERGRSA